MEELKHCGTILIETNRLILKKIENADAEDMFLNFAHDDRVSRYMSWDSFKTVEDSIKWIDEWQVEYNKEDVYYWGIYLKSSHKLIGTIYLLTESTVSKVGSLSYCLGFDYWGNGYVCEAVDAVIDFAFNKIGYNRVEAYYAKSNLQSARVLQKVGMKKEGTLRQRCKTHNDYEDCIYYSILKSEFKS